MKVGFKKKLFSLYLIGLSISIGLSVISFKNQKSGMYSVQSYLSFQKRLEIWRDMERFYQSKLASITLGNLKKDAQWKDSFLASIDKENLLSSGLESNEALDLLKLNQNQKDFLLQSKSKELMESLRKERILIVKQINSLREESISQNESLMLSLRGWLNLLTYYSLGMSAIFTLFLVLYKFNNKSQQALESERKKREFMLDSLDSGVLLLDNQFKVISYNQKARQLWGASLTEPMISLESLLPIYHIENEQGDLLQVEFKGSELWKDLESDLIDKGFQMSFSLRNLGVQPQWFQLEAKTFKRELYLLNFQNITHIVEAQNLIKKQQASLIEQSKMTALGQMSSGMAHEINNPLAIISSEAEELLEIAEDEGQVSQKDAESISINIKKTTDRIAKIIRGLRIFARQTDASEKAETNISHLVDEVISMSSEKFKSNGVKFNVNIPSELKEEQNQVFANEVQLLQVLVNLLNNAYDAIKEQNDKRIGFEWRVLPDCHLFTISDNGPGIDSKNKVKIFDPFFTTKKVGHGTGLGLSLSKSIIEDHGGHLELLESQEGASFLVKLPIKILNCEGDESPLDEEEKWTA